LWVFIAVAALAGCAGLSSVGSDVSSYSLWPADRKPSTYVFERLPSQEADSARQQVLEDAAHHAMQTAGFTAVADAASADVTVTLGARVSPQERSPFDDPFWWHGGLYGHHHFGRPFFHPAFGPYFGDPFYDTPRYQREVAMLIRDHKTGRPLYETHATNDGYSPSISGLLPAMFDASMSDFPKGVVNWHHVVAPMPPR